MPFTTEIEYLGSKAQAKICPCCHAKLGIDGFRPIEIIMQFLIRGELIVRTFHNLECPECGEQFFTSRQAAYLGGTISRFKLNFGG